MSIRSLSLALTVALVAPGSIQGQADRVQWLRASLVALSDTASDADLAPIRRALDGVDVIFLGESSHGDGGGHLARARLVRYLHEQLGFDVIAWEAGVREAVAFDSLLGTNAPLSRITPLALSPWWAPSAELRPVLEYVRQTRQRGFARMATMTGASRDSVEDALEHTWLEAAADLRQRFVAQRTSFVRALGQRDTELLGRVLENVAANAEQMRLARDADPAKRIASYNLREQRNAENVLWLLRERHRGEKIIVWSHNVHAINARFTARFDDVSLDPSTAPRDATARIVKDSIGGGRIRWPSFPSTGHGASRAATGPSFLPPPPDRSRRSSTTRAISAHFSTSAAKVARCRRG